ncbi:MAG TPA: NAD(P)/FAD-dependent oxidoreductase [Methanospirillum sp.]|nr:NAD(P)/FAD-dependent oxidoreductase [Methanospirillum sp.]HOJ96335.1 NAD(P)/FAD-dependent oxidoreductase [Methanospirillum sp.]HOL40857.1 NAD(P)/FAD-dependent oxidoreductase [Methanospirillum sp.]HPP76909.1 NAD(P)/FAD-dependent oxidoreductase [Methanospirillum sp.]
MNRTYDVVVVGGGPTGSTAARICAKSGLKTLLIEEQATFGYPVQCAGLLSQSAFSECEVSMSSVLNTVSGADIHAGEATCSFDAGKTMAYVVDRGALDQEMGLAAADAGAEIQLKSIAYDISRISQTVSLKGISGSEDVRYSMLIAADGPRSGISRKLGIPRARYYLSGLQCDVFHSVSLDHVQIYPNAAPDFFGWMIPIHPDRTRIGLCGIHQVKERFSEFIRPFSKQILHFVSGTIPLGPPSRTYDNRILIAGDAAAMAKPTSGGGVYTGVRSARHAAETAIRSIETDDFSPASMALYEQAWKADFGHEILRGLRFFQIRQKISEKEMEKLIRILAHPDIKQIITNKGDMDRPSALIKALLTNPHMIPAYSIIGKGLLSSIYT